MLSTDFVLGSPCWLDLGAPDVDAAADFYGAVFGWQRQMLDPEPGGYGLFRLDGKVVGAVGPLTEAGARAAWMIYFGTPDADATASTVRRLGGTVRVAPLDADGEGRMAQFTDPLGGQFAVWQPGKSHGLEVVRDPGTLTWTELCTTDSAAAKEFYGTLFGWTTDDVPLPGGDGTYSLITPSGYGQDWMQGGIVQLQAEQLPGGAYWHPVFEVADCDVTVGRVTANGGSVLMGPEDAEGVGRMAVCHDPSGAELVVLASAPA